MMIAFFLCFFLGTHLHPSMIGADQTPTTIYSSPQYQTTVRWTNFISEHSFFPVKKKKNELQHLQCRLSKK